MCLMHNSLNRYLDTGFGKKIGRASEKKKTTNGKNNRKTDTTTTSTPATTAIKWEQPEKNTVYGVIFGCFGVFLSISLACNPYYIRIHLNETIFILFTIPTRFAVCLLFWKMKQNSIPFYFLYFYFQLLWN